MDMVFLPGRPPPEAELSAMVGGNAESQETPLDNILPCIVAVKLNVLFLHRTVIGMDMSDGPQDQVQY